MNTIRFMETKFKSLTVTEHKTGLTLEDGNKTVELYRVDGKLRIGGVGYPDMPKTISDVEALAIFWQHVHQYLNGIL